MQISTCPIDTIVVQDRLRQELGDLTDLKRSMTERGLINPITVRESNILIAGERRLQAARELGWLEIDVHVWRPADGIELLSVEAEENTCRKPLTPGEAERYWQRLKKLMEPDAKANQARAGQPRTAPADVHPGQKNPDEHHDEAARVRTRAAKATGYSVGTLKRVAQVRRIAQDPTQSQQTQEVAEREYTKLMEGTTKVKPALAAVHDTMPLRRTPYGGLHVVPASLPTPEPPPPPPASPHRLTRAQRAARL